MDADVRRKSIAIIGHGYVGRAMERLFEKHYDIVIKDPKTTVTYDMVNECDLKVICVPTPAKKSGKCDTSIVEEVVENLEGLVLIKSTVPPGTTEKLGSNVCFSPEYIGEGTYYTDPKYPHPTDTEKHSFLIVGGKKEVAEKVVQFFLPVMGPNVKYRITDSRTAEAVKYMVNTWAAHKVTFANEWYEIAKALNVSYTELRDLWLLDTRVEPMHTAVFVDKRGYGGKCLPKDIKAVVKFAKEAGYDAEFIKEAIASNERIQNGAKE